MGYFAVRNFVGHRQAQEHLRRNAFERQRRVVLKAEAAVNRPAPDSILHNARPPASMARPSRMKQNALAKNPQIRRL
jgi:hypothetical protein